MPEAEVGGMEHQAVRLTAAVEPVADDGPAETGAMGAVDPELMGSTGVWNQPEKQGSCRSCMQNFILGDGGFPVHGIDPLPWPVVPVGSQGEGDLAMIARLERGLAGFGCHHQRQIGFCHFAVFELLLQGGLDFQRLGEDHQAGGVHVEPVTGKDRRVGLRGTAISGKPVLKRTSWRDARNRTSGYRQHAGWFVHHDQRGIFVPHNGIGQMPVRIAFEGIGLHVHALQHIAEQRPAFACTSWVEGPVTTDFPGRRGAEPELADSQRLESVRQSVLQQFRCRAVAGSAGRNEPAVSEKLPDGASLAPAVGDDILLKKPILQPAGLFW